MSTAADRGPRSPLGRYALIVGSALVILFIWIVWYAENSDRDDIPAVLTHIIPAGSAICQTSTSFQCSSCLELSESSANETDRTWEYIYGRDDQDLGLTDAQCSIAFPGLFEDIRFGVSHWQNVGNVTAESLNDINLGHGMTRAMIHRGDLYVVATRSKGEDHRRKTVAVLSAMNRALLAAGDRRALPDIEFVFSIEDKATDVVKSEDTPPLWVLARKAHEDSMFLLPDFGFWAWDNIIGNKTNEIGPYDEVLDKALTVESDLPFRSKHPQLVWRGKLSFAPKLRRGLLDASRGKGWSAVKELNWNVPENYLTLEDHCKYMFIAHVEGRSYSASLKYRQACRSVIVAHRLQYIQHHHYLLVAEGPHQNYVEVERDFTDLPSKMADLLADPEKAQRIADNSVRTFRERYLTPAAEACYWRALWRGYGTVSEAAQLWRHSPSGLRRKRGVRFETFVLLPSMEMTEFHAE